MVEVKALFGFDHGPKKIKRGQTFSVSEQTAQQLERNRLVQRTGSASEPVPPEATGEKSSASPAAPASPQTTANESADGETKDPEQQPQDEAGTGRPSEQPAKSGKKGQAAGQSS